MFALALLVLCLVPLWLTGVPGSLTPVSYLLFATLLTAFTVVTMITYVNAQAPTSLAQMIHEADMAPSSAAVDDSKAAMQGRPLA